MISDKDSEIKELKKQLSSLSPPPESLASQPHLPTLEPTHSVASRTRRGKAPPVDSFTGEDLETRLDDWLPSLERARVWNEWIAVTVGWSSSWTSSPRVWSLLSDAVKMSYADAVKALRLRLDPGSRTLAAQEFRHTSQGCNEWVADFIRRLERTFNVAYGQEGMSTETRDTLLHGQLQDALKHELMQAPAVSGAQTYQELCLAARNEQKRQAELKKRQQYIKPSVQQQQTKKPIESQPANRPPPFCGSNPASQDRKCFLCHEPGHLARNCPKKATSRGQPQSQSKTKQVTSGTEQGRFESLQELLDSSGESEGEDVRVVRLTDKGSQPQCIKLQVQGVPAYGIIDSGADITIMGGALFKKVAAVARFKKRDLKRPDKAPRNYDHTPFTLDGRIDMDMSFDGKTMRTPVYIKTDAQDKLLLSGGVCRQLSILHYHSAVEAWRGGRKHRQSRPNAKVSSQDAPAADTPVATHSSDAVEVGVPTVRVRLLQSVKLLPHQGATVAVQVDGNDHLKAPQRLVVEPNQDAFLRVQDSLLQVQEDNPICVQVFNPIGVSCQMEAGFELGEAMEAELVEAEQHLAVETGTLILKSNVSLPLACKLGKKSCVR